MDSTCSFATEHSVKHAFASVERRWVIVTAWHHECLQRLDI